MTLRDELAAVLGPGNDDLTAYAQAGYVLEVLLKYSPGGLDYELTQAWRELKNVDH